VSLFQAVERIFLGWGDVFEERADVAQLEVARVAFVVAEDPTACPAGVAFPGSVLTKVVPRHLADEVEQARGLGRGWVRKGAGSHEDLLRQQGRSCG
jgi:hypothetical protein